jgi:holo-[acyl-carrier protein] synthase
MIKGIGTDIIEIARIQSSIKRFGDAFLNHILTKEEMAHAKKFKSPYQHYAGRFAAKEAIYKAFGDPKLAWHDICISNDKHGRPQCTIRKKKSKKVLLSISHCKTYATAMAVVTA